MLLLIADIVLMPILAGHLSFTSEVPDLVGKSKAEAEALLAKQSLLVTWDSVGRYSATVPVGSVLIQVPAPGRRVKHGRTVHLTPSKGLREVTVPDLRGKSQRQAEISLARLGLVEGRLLKGAHVSIPRDVVIRTEPAAGKVLRVGDRVDVVISAGAVQGRQKLPELSGLPLERASAILDSLGFQIGTVSRKPLPKKTSNSVLEQRPASGEYLDAGTSVDLVIVD